MFGSVTGTWPGVNIGPVNIPLVPDLYTNITIGNANSALLTLFRGVIGRNGMATATFNVPKTGAAAAVGVTAWHAYTTFNSSGTVFDASNAAPIQFIK